MVYEPLKKGEIATLVTYLEMLEPPANPGPSSDLKLHRVENPEPDEYRRIFRRVGAQWLWFSRLLLNDETLSSIIQHPKVRLFLVLDAKDLEIGFVELDFREAGTCELAFIGLVPELTGQGHGRWLLAETLHIAWSQDIKRVHVHTCSLDHPSALTAYRRAGFVPYAREIERFQDPRLLGILPRDCAPQVPLIG